MANATAKKNIIKNKKRMQLFTLITVGINALWLLGSLYLFSTYYIEPATATAAAKKSSTTAASRKAKQSDTTESTWATDDGASTSAPVPEFQYVRFAITFSFWLGQELLALRFLRQRGEPQFDENGELDAVADLSDPQQLGFASYAQDALWVCWSVQLLTCYVTRWAWVLYLCVPAFAAHKAWTMLVQPLLAMRQQAAAAGQQAGPEGAGQYEADPRARLAKKREEAQTARGKKGADKKK
jgi:hypothetical protein